MKNLFTFIQNCFTDGWQFTREQYAQAKKASVTKVSLDELIFQNREKEYGAYMLRKNHNWHLATALAFACSVFLYAALLPVFLGLMKYDSSETEKVLKDRILCDCGGWYELSKPPHADKLKSGKIEKKSTVSFHIPKPAPPKEITYSGKGKDRRNSVQEIHEYTSPYSAPDTIIPIAKNYDLFWSGLDTTTFYPRYQFYGGDEIAECISCDDEYPEPGTFIFVEAEPIPINMDEVGNCVAKEIPSWCFEGKFIFRVLVDKKGNYVRHISMLKGHPVFEQAIENCLPNLKFTPAIYNGKPIPFWVNIPFNIKLL